MGKHTAHEVMAEAFWREDHRGMPRRMEKMGAAESDLDSFFPEKKHHRNPLVPIGAFVTAGVLTAGLISFKQGNSQLGQKLMRARVLAQGATVAIMVGSAYYYGDKV